MAKKAKKKPAAKKKKKPFRREDNPYSGIWRLRHHPLTLSSAKPAFEWSKHRCMPHEERGKSSRKPNNLSVRYLTQHKVFVFSAGSQMGKY